MRSHKFSKIASNTFLSLVHCRTAEILVQTRVTTIISRLQSRYLTTLSSTFFLFRVNFRTAEILVQIR